MTKTNAFYLIQWLWITLVCYRIQRLFTTDSFYPFRRLRRSLSMGTRPGTQRFHLRTELYELITCPHCLSVWITSAFYFIAAYFHHLTLPYTFIQAVATMGAISVIADHGHDGE